MHVLCQSHPVLHWLSKHLLHRAEAQCHKVIVLCNFCERNSFSGARFQLQWRWGMFLGLIQPGGGLTSIWAQRTYTAPSKRSCDESLRTSCMEEVVMYTHESRHSHPECPSKDCLFLLSLNLRAVCIAYTKSPWGLSLIQSRFTKINLMIILRKLLQHFNRRK